MNADQRAVLEDWKDDCRLLMRVHLDKAAQCERRTLYIGLPAVVLSAIVGTTVFASLGKVPQNWATVLVGSVSLLVSVLAGLQAYLKFP